MDDLTYKIYLTAFTSKLIADSDVCAEGYNDDNMQHVAAVALGCAHASREKPIVASRAEVAVLIAGLFGDE